MNEKILYIGGGGEWLVKEDCWFSDQSKVPINQQILNIVVEKQEVFFRRSRVTLVNENKGQI